MIDFYFNGQKLSDHGCIVVGFNTAFQDSIQFSDITFETIKNRSGESNKIVNAKYDNVLSSTFDVCKNPCLYKTDEEKIFSDVEISDFMRWVNQKKYFKFKPIYENDSYQELYFLGSFTSISGIIINGKVIGFTLTFTSNAPFGYADEKEYIASLSSPSDQFIFYDDSDEIGFCYPDFFQIECLSNGNLEFHNNRDTRSTVINNCLKNEVIIMDCSSKIIQSSLNHPSLYNDFNYNYPRIFNDINDRFNIFSASISCNIKIKYSPIRKVGIIV